MRFSNNFAKTSKTLPKDETSLNAQLLIKAGFVDKLMAGVYTMLPLGFRVYKKIEHIIREEMNSLGAQEIYMPTLQPKQNWETTGRWDEVDVLFKLDSNSDNKQLALGPTHEEVITPLVKRFVSSYKDLPFSAYHIQNKFRNEKRAKSGVLRGREFIMKDLYSFHQDQADLEDFYEKASKAYEAIFSRTGIADLTYKTYASGGTFSKYSHEFQTLTEAGEDLIYICDKCRVAINKEILTDQKNCCPECQNKELREEKAVEVGNIFKLGNKFSSSFDLKFADEKGLMKDVIMGCYGIGLQRLMGTIVEACHDEKGIIWPESVAPFRIHLISIGQNDKADEIYGELLSSGIEVLYDDRKEVTVGAKFADADLIGCPIRLIVSEKTMKENCVEYKRRNEEESKMVKIEELKEFV